MNIPKDISKLLSEGVIDQETADRLVEYYKAQKANSTSRLFIVFGILGGLLVGLGLILIFAHNWDQLSRNIKTLLAISPLLLAQLCCAYVILKKYNSITWRESSSTFLVFAIGASIALVSQTYNIPGDITSFMLTWLLLGLPLVYLMQSSVTSLMYIMGLTYYVATTHYWRFPASESLIYWPLLTMIVPYYYQLLKNRPRSNFTIFHNWVIPLSITALLGTLVKDHEELIFLAYMSLFGAYLGLGELRFFKSDKIRNNGFMVIGSLGSIGLLLILSSFGFWENMTQFSWVDNMLFAPEFYAALILTSLAIYLYSVQIKNTSYFNKLSTRSAFLFFIPIFILGFWSPASTIFINLLLLLLGVTTIARGTKENHLGIINFGLLIITFLIFARFFDTNISFVIRGLLFMLIGIGFFVANYKMLQKRKSHD